MAESWRQKRVDIVHWLQGIRPPSPEPLRESDWELTSSSDITTTDELSELPPVTRPISPHPHPNIEDNTVLLHSKTHSKPSPVSEHAACVSFQSSLSSAPQLYSMHHRVKQFDVKSFQRKTPLPQATPEPKLPTFVTFEEDATTPEETLDQPTVNKIVNRPPSRPMRYMTRASTSPVLSDSSLSPPMYRKAATLSKNYLQPNNVHSLRVDSDLMKSRRKSMSQNDLSYLLERETKLSMERHCSDSKLQQNDPSQSDGGSQSSTGACGRGSDPSDMSSTRGETITEESSAAMKRRQFGKSIISPGSVDVLTTRIREIKLEMGVMDEDDVSLALPTHLLSPTSPTPSHHSHLSYSPSSTPPTSPYHTPIVPLSVRSESSHLSPLLRPAGENQSGISKSRLKQFNQSQQFSFDTTNDDELISAPSRHPKFLKKNVSMFSKSHSISHCRSHSDVSSIPSLSHSSAQPVQESRELSTTHNPENKSKRQYKSQMELSSLRTSSPEGSKPLPIYELLQLKRQQIGGKTGGDSITKSRLLRQDSGIGTLSTISQKFL